MTGYLDLIKAVAPEAVVVLGALVSLGVDFLVARDLPPRARKTLSVLVATVACLLAAGWSLAIPAHGSFLEGAFLNTDLSAFVKAVLLLFSTATLVLWMDAEPHLHPGEYCALVLLASVGMMFMVSSGDLLLLFISLELSSVCLYVLAALNKHQPQSAEAALKYFLVGGVAAAFTLYGISIMYVVTGSTRLAELASAIWSAHPLVNRDPLVTVGILMLSAAFAFKVAAVPFHLWAPDVYQGAPLTSAAFIASGSKIAGFVVLGQLAFNGFSFAGEAAFKSTAWPSVMMLLAALSMVWGNLAAIVQGNVRRLLAYSAVAHAGYMLIAVLSPSGTTIASLIYYAVTYAAAALGAFAVVSNVEREMGGSEMTHFAGLSKNSPVLASCMLIFVLSLAGIPPLAGFFGKFYVFVGALSGGHAGWALLWIVVLAIAASAVSLYYYLRLLKHIYVLPPQRVTGGSVPLATLICMIGLALVVVVLGCFPELLLRSFHLPGANQ